MRNKHMHIFLMIFFFLFWGFSCNDLTTLSEDEWNEENGNNESSDQETNNPISVDVTSSKSKAYSFQPFTLTASVTEPNSGATLSYKWYYDDSLISDFTTYSDSYYLYGGSGSSSEIYKCVVTDSYGNTASDTVSITYQACGTLKVINTSGYSITALYISSSSSWGSDWLTGDITSIPTGYYFYQYAITSGSYYLKVHLYGKGDYYTSTTYSFNSALYRVATVTSSKMTLGSSSSLSVIGEMFNMTSPVNTVQASILDSLYNESGNMKECKIYRVEKE